MKTDIINQYFLLFPKTGIQKPNLEIKLDVIFKNRNRKAGIISKTFHSLPEK